MALFCILYTTYILRKTAIHGVIPVIDSENPFYIGAMIGGALLFQTNVIGVVRLILLLIAMALLVVEIHVFPLAPIGPLDFYFLASFAVGSLQLSRARSEDFVTKVRSLLLGLALAAGTIVSPNSLLSLSGAKRIYDPSVLNFDQHLGIRIPVLVATFVSLNGALAFATKLSYLFTPAFVAIFDCMSLRNNRSLSMTARFLISGSIGFFIYPFIPIGGPHNFDPSYADSLWSTSDFYNNIYTDVVGSGPTNGMPSLHTTWALMFSFSAWRINQLWVRSLFYAVSIFTILGALTIGEHWFLDIVVAVPFAFALNCLFEDGQRKITWTICCMAVAFMWFGALKVFNFSMISQPEAWVLVVLTSVWPWIPNIVALLRNFKRPGVQEVPVSEPRRTRY